jgi:DNA (cytosine-5)-methyltransferase 1
MTTIGTLFSGGEGVGAGARQAGLDHLWGIEYDDAIAQVGRMNGFNTITGNVMDAALMMTLPRPDVIHASPVCKNASNAKANGEESPLDIDTADATCAYIDHFLPDIFTLENVYGYRVFTAFAHIIECLNRNGYSVDYWHLNAADYGVPQTRRRLILVAKLHGKPHKPVATHAEPSKLTPMFDTRKPWVGWYAAIEDLIDTLQDSEFEQWQLDRLPKEITDTFIFDGHSGFCGDEATQRTKDQPVMSIMSTYRGNAGFRAFIVEGTNGSHRDISRLDHEPITTIVQTEYKSVRRAWLDCGRVVRMTPRALARFQSIPDSYILPDKARLACTVIGNAVPPLLYQRVIEAQLTNSQGVSHGSQQIIPLAIRLESRGGAV